MKLYLSFEQELVVSDLPDAPKTPTSPDPFHHGFVEVAHGKLYDGPGATQPPGNVLSFIGPIHDRNGDEAIRQAAKLLRSLGHEVSVCGVDH